MGYGNITIARGHEFRRSYIPKNVGITIGRCDGYGKENLVDGSIATVLKYSVIS